MLIDDVKQCAIDNDLIPFDMRIDQLVFEERVKLMCVNCTRYRVNWTCPGKMPKIDYQKVFTEYTNGLFLMYRSPILSDKQEYEHERYVSTNKVHKTLLKMEKLLWDSNEFMRLSFIGGGCKLCKNGCAEDNCRNPLMARVPLEATGCNVMKSAFNIVDSETAKDIKFTEKYIYRFGLIVW